MRSLGSDVNGDGGNEPVVLVYEVKCRVFVDTAEVDGERKGRGSRWEKAVLSR
jgi:hypothetical protein